MSTPSYCKIWSLLIVALFLAHFSVFAQEAPVKFGKVTEEEVRMKVYDKDTSATAVILADYGTSYFTYRDNFKIVFERVLRIKILKKGGYNWANVEVPCFVQSKLTKEYVSDIKGTTYNWEDGKLVKIKMDDKAIFDEKKNEDWVVKKFALPAVKEGSVLDISYTVTSDFVFNYRPWNFQHSIPVVYSEYRASYPQYFEYKQYMQGYEPIQVNESKSGHMSFFANDIIGFRGPVTASTKEHRWVMQNLPALASESYITTLDDYVSRIEFELVWARLPGQEHDKVTATWESFTNELLEQEMFGGQLNRTNAFKAEVAAFTAIKDTLARVNAVYNFVNQKVKWNNKIGVLAPNNLRKAFENKAGSAQEINLLLVALLQDAGLKASPVVLSTRDHGRIPHYSPLLTKFNYVIGSVLVGGKELLLDGTDPMQPLGMLPERCLNGEGWLVAKNASKWVPLQSPDRSVDFLSAELQLAPTGKFSGLVKESTGGYYGLSLRKAITEQGESGYLEKFAKDQSKVVRRKPVLKNLKELQHPIHLEYEIESEGDAQVKDIIYLNPMVLKGQKENPFKLAERKFPIDFTHAKEDVYMCSFTIPEGYAVEELPKDIAVSLPDNGGRFTYKLQVAGNKIQVMSKVTIAKPIFYAGEYQHLKQFYTQVVAKHAEQIVLRKKG